MSSGKRNTELHMLWLVWIEFCDGSLSLKLLKMGNVTQTLMSHTQPITMIRTGHSNICLIKCNFLQHFFACVSHVWFEDLEEIGPWALLLPPPPPPRFSLELSVSISSLSTWLQSFESELDEQSQTNMFRNRLTTRVSMLRREMSLQQKGNPLIKRHKNAPYTQLSMVSYMWNLVILSPSK